MGDCMAWFGIGVFVGNLHATLLFGVLAWKLLSRLEQVGIMYKYGEILKEKEIKP